MANKEERRVEYLAALRENLKAENHAALVAAHRAALARGKASA